MRRIIQRFKVAAPTQVMFRAQRRGVFMHEVRDFFISRTTVIHVDFALKNAAINREAKIVHR